MAQRITEKDRRKRTRLMIPLPDFKNLLGKYAESLNEEQIKQLQNMEYQIADAIFDQWLKKHNEHRLEKAGNIAPSRHNVDTEENIGQSINTSFQNSNL